VDGQPTSRHFSLRVYDDVVTLESVATPDQIAKTTHGFQMSDNLGARGGAVRVIGTRYHLFDTYSTMIDSGAFRQRVHPATLDGTEVGVPVLMNREELRKKRQVQGPYVFASQMLLNPTADKAMGFNRNWLVHADVEYNAAMTALWRFILVDPAGSKQRKNNDYTTMMVFGYGEDERYRLLDMRRDRMNLSTRARTLIDLHKHWRPGAVGYEEYGMQADIEHIKHVQATELYEFDIIPLGGGMSKTNRVLRLVPYFENGFKSQQDGGDGMPKSRIVLPHALMQVDYQGHNRDLVKDFVEQEFVAFPVLSHDDMLDCMARIVDLEQAGAIQKPSIVTPPSHTYRDGYSPMGGQGRISVPKPFAGGWETA
jgi:phage terminase large subunit-like protein